jgi:ABC-2 type transport system permease protein
MTSSSDAMSEPAVVAPAAAGRSVRPFFWSVRRELWENRSIYLAPAIAAAVVLAGMVLAVVTPHHVRVNGSSHMPADALVMIPYGIAVGAIVITGCLVGLFYCLGAVNGERRDRSILFWKSLPVSNLTALASKAFTAMAVLPVAVLATVVATHLIILVLQAVRMAATGESLSTLEDLPLLHVWLGMAWGLFATALWWAPIYGWLLMISAYAKRMTFLWAVLPPIGVIVFEKLAFDTNLFGQILRDRFNGSIAAAFQVPRGQPVPHDSLRHIIDLPTPDPVGFFTSPGLWIGLAVGAAFFAAAVWLRRRAEPV